MTNRETRRAAGRVVRDKLKSAGVLATIADNNWVDGADNSWFTIDKSDNGKRLIFWPGDAKISVKTNASKRQAVLTVSEEPRVQFTESVYYYQGCFDEEHELVEAQSAYDSGEVTDKGDIHVALMRCIDNWHSTSVGSDIFGQNFMEGTEYEVVDSTYIQKPENSYASSWRFRIEATTPATKTSFLVGIRNNEVLADENVSWD